jgi:hypothetical protein
VRRSFHRASRDIFTHPQRLTAYPLFRTYVDFYFVGMLVSDMIQALGASCTAKKYTLL